MLEILFENWQKKLKLVDDKKLFKVLFLIGGLLSIGLTVVCECYVLQSNDYVLFIIINGFLVIYNKPTILCNIQRKRNIVFLINRSSLMRFVTFEVLSENVLIIVAIVSSGICLIYESFLGNAIVVVALLLIPLNYYLIDVYSKYQKLLLVICIVILSVLLIYKLELLMIIFGLANVFYLYKTFHSQLIVSIFSDQHKRIFTGKSDINIYRVALMYFLRMPLDKFVELFYEILLFGIALHYIDVNSAYYIVIILFIVEIEIIQEEKMKEFAIFYNKRNFLELSKCKKYKLFFRSTEFNHALKYFFILFGFFGYKT